MKVLVTGSEGMLGRALISSLGSREIQTEGVDSHSRERPIDITKHVSLMDFVAEADPDLVVHAAAYTDVDGCEKVPADAYLVNSEGTRNVAEACRKVKCPMVYISTDYVFDGNAKVPYKEDDVRSPINVYGMSKLEGENFVRNILPSYLIIRTSWLFGEGGRNFVDSIISLAESGKRLKVVDDQKGCPTYTIDLSECVCELLLKVIARSRDSFFRDTPVLNITNTGSCSWYEFAKEILRQKGIKADQIKPAASEDIDRPAKRPRMSVLDTKRFIKVYGRPLPTWQDALGRYLNRNS